MKDVLLAALLVMLPTAGYADSASPASCLLRIHATGFRNQKGAAGAGIFSSPDGWPEREDKSVAHNGFPITGDHALLSFRVPPGKYGVVVLHDENENHKLDRNFLGVPTEGFGFANNPRVFLTAPPFQSAEVNVVCPVTDITVKLIYK
jgi:uncharacterized protein (DUF2141 family)